MYMQLSGTRGIVVSFPDPIPKGGGVCMGTRLGELRFTDLKRCLAHTMQWMGSEGVLRMLQPG